MININRQLVENKWENKRCLFRYVLTLFVVMVIFYGCSSKLKNYSHLDVAGKNLNRLAVLPLENLTADQYADEKIRSLVIMDLLSRGVDVIETGEVMRVYKELRVGPFDPISAKTLQSLGDLLDVDTVLKGSVGTYEMKKGVSVSFPEVSVHLMLVDTASGDILWSAWHTSGGASFWTRHFGAEGKTLDMTARNVIREALDSLY